MQQITLDLGSEEGREIETDLGFDADRLRSDEGFEFEDALPDATPPAPVRPVGRSGS